MLDETPDFEHLPACPNRIAIVKPLVPCDCGMVTLERRRVMLDETPDFDQIARELLDHLPDELTRVPRVPRVAEQLRQVWNLRGAADCRAIDQRLSALTGWVTSEPYRKQLREAIEAADVPGP